MYKLIAQLTLVFVGLAIQYLIECYFFFLCISSIDAEFCIYQFSFVGKVGMFQFSYVFMHFLMLDIDNQQGMWHTDYAQLQRWSYTLKVSFPVERKPII